MILFCCATARVLSASQMDISIGNVAVQRQEPFVGQLRPFGG